jgi:hypothetical protein
MCAYKYQEVEYAWLMTTYNLYYSLTVSDQIKKVQTGIAIIMCGTNKKCTERLVDDDEETTCEI